MAGTISFPGIGSGLDVDALLKSTYEQLTLRNTIYRRNVDTLKTENTGLEQLRSLLANISSTLDSARSSNGGISGSKATSSSNSDVLTAAAGSSAITGSFSVTVTSLASSATGSFDRNYSSENDFVISDPSQVGDVEFTVGSGADATTFSVAVDELTSVEDFVSDFNSQASGKATASLVNVGTEASPAYRIAFSSTNVGEEKGSISVSSSNAALMDASALAGTTLSQASNAVFQVSGISGTIERSSNTVSDVVSGVTLRLSGIGTAAVTVRDDVDAGAERLESFASEFNKLVEFLNTEDSITSVVEDGERSNIYGDLARTNVDDASLSTLRSAISSARSSDGSLSLAAIGISTDRDGTVTFDRDKFDAAFNSNPSGVNEVITSLADKIAGVQGSLHQFTGFGLQIDQEISSNESEISRLEETIATVERNAKTREEGIRAQFTNLDKLFAKFESASSFISSLLRL